MCRKQKNSYELSSFLEKVNDGKLTERERERERRKASAEGYIKPLCLSLHLGPCFYTKL
jgi:hypothetical protein